jgi:hypothetical protein
VSRGRINGTVTCEELAGGPVSVSAHAECVGSDSAVARDHLLDGPGEFSLDVPAGTWWVLAVLAQQGLPGAGALSAWSHRPVTVAAGEEVAGVDIVVEVPENVR